MEVQILSGAPFLIFRPQEDHCYLSLWAALQGLGYANLGLDLIEEARPCFERGLQVLEKHQKPDEAEVASAVLDLASFYQQARESDKVVPLLLRAAAIWEKRRAETDFDELKFHYGRSLVQVYFRLGIIYQSRKHPAEAESYYQKALTEGQTLFDAADMEGIYQAYASLLQATGRNAEIPALKERLDAHRKRPTVRSTPR